MSTAEQELNQVAMQKEVIRSDIQTYSTNLKLEFTLLSQKVRAISNDLRNDPNFSQVSEDLSKAQRIVEATRFKDPERQSKATYEQLTAAKADAAVRHLRSAIDTAKKTGSRALEDRIGSLTPSVELLSNNRSALINNLQRLHKMEDRVETHQRTIKKPPAI